MGTVLAFKTCDRRGGKLADETSPLARQGPKISALHSIITSVTSSLIVALLIWLVYTVNESAGALTLMNRQLVEVSSSQKEQSIEQRRMRDDILLFSSTYITKDMLEQRLDSLRKEMELVSQRIALLENRR